LKNFGRATPARMARMRTTAISSMRVKPFLTTAFRLMIGFPSLLVSRVFRERPSALYPMSAPISHIGRKMASAMMRNTPARPTIRIGSRTVGRFFVRWATSRS